MRVSHRSGVKEGGGKLKTVLNLYTRGKQMSRAGTVGFDAAWRRLSVSRFAGVFHSEPPPKLKGKRKTSMYS